MNNVCAHCQQDNMELEAAHVHGNSRKSIIESILEKYKSGDQVEIDIQEVEEEIIKAHHPITESFLFLCRGCHIKYDSNEGIEHKIKNQSSAGNNFKKNEDSNELENEVRRVQNKLPRWFRNKNQYNSRILYAFIRLHEKNPNVTLEDLKRESNLETFDINFTQMKTIAPQNHGKVFELEGQYVKLWDRVEDIVWSYYEQYK